MSEEDVYFDMESQRYVYGQKKVDRDITDIIFFDETQTIRYETWTKDGYIVSKHMKIEDEKEYFKRKLTGK